MTTSAVHPQEPVLKATALQLTFEFLCDIPRQSEILRLKVLLEWRAVFVNDLVREGALRVAAHLNRHTQAQTGFPTGG